MRAKIKIRKDIAALGRVFSPSIISKEDAMYMLSMKEVRCE